MEKGYVREDPKGEQSNSKWYLPHFLLVRPDVNCFWCLCKLQNGLLNERIHQGPKLQRGPFDVLLRFRRYVVAVLCDIDEMYLRISLHPEDKPYRITMEMAVFESCTGRLRVWQGCVWGKFVSLPDTFLSATARKEIQKWESYGWRNRWQVDIHGRFERLGAEWATFYQIIQSAFASFVESRNSC